ncbi:MAG TPA: hypothetical protein VN369_05240 [Terriglobales bacterium]|nr:hypothetical protein [Terriglobales bacterium]
MNIVGQPVRHRTFGPGVITALTGGIATVCFQDSEKKFIYPDAFKDFLTLRDRGIQQCIEEQAACKEAAIQERNQEEQAQRNRRQKLLNFKVISNSHAAFNIPPEHAGQVCETYMLSTGTYLNGYSKGQPRVADRIKPNSVCLLTSRPDGQAEPKRRILGACMVAEDFFGEDNRDGIIEGHPQYRLAVPAERQMLFWEYFNRSTPPCWGKTPFKYCSGEMIHKILFKLMEFSETAAQREASIEFYEYFCKRNLLPPLMPPDANAES